MRNKFITFTRVALAGLIGFGLGRMNEVRAAETSGAPVEQAADGSRHAGGERM